MRDLEKIMASGNKVGTDTMEYIKNSMQALTEECGVAAGVAYVMTIHKQLGDFIKNIVPLLKSHADCNGCPAKEECDRINNLGSNIVKVADMGEFDGNIICKKEDDLDD